MGGLFGPSEQKTTQQTNPYAGLPGWAKEYYQGDKDRALNLIQEAGTVADFRANNPDVIAGMTPDEVAAIEGVLAENEQNQAMIDDAKSMVGGDQFEASYIDDVVDPTLANMDRQQDRRDVERNARSRAVGGTANTRAGVADAVADSNYEMQRAQMEAQLRDDAERYGVEAGMQGANTMAGLAGTGQDLQTTASQWQGTGGETQRSITQKRNDLPKSALSWYTDAFNASRGLPSTGGGTSTKTEPGPSPFSQILGAASTAAGIWSALSDERAKENVEEIDGALESLRGVDSYSYNYRPGLGHTEERTAGLMAQDLERSSIPGAVMQQPDGYKHVDPYPVLATVVKAVRELDDRTRETGD
jgi:hypothetical protein